MHRNFLILFALAVLISCKENRKTNSPARATDSGVLQENEPTVNSRIRFDVNGIDHKSNNPFLMCGSPFVAFTVHCELYNDAIDTAYFLSSTCNGLDHQLIYDTSSFSDAGLINCNAPYPIIIKIPPKGDFEFDTWLCPKKQTNELRLGIAFYEVQKDFDLKNASLSDVYHQETKEQAILGAPVKRIN